MQYFTILDTLINYILRRFKEYPKLTNMKKGFLRIGFLLFILLGFLQVKAQDITIISTFGSSSAANPVSLCQCDTLGVSSNPITPGNLKPELKYDISGGNFSALTKFYFEMASPNNSWGTADSLQLWSLTGLNDATPVDTFGIGGKEAQLIIPCNAPLGPATIRIRNSSGVISDTAFVLINRLPDKPIIDSIAFGFPNPYTTTLDDWSFCAGDSVILYAEKQPGASYQWLNGGAPISGETNDSLVVKTSGHYAVRVDFGACARDSKDTIINISIPLTNITFSPTSPGYQIDNPRTRFSNPIDSIQFCENTTAVLVGPEPAPATMLTYKYQWLTDSITQFGDTVFYMVSPGDTLRTQNIDTTGRYYIVTYDGLCTDTSQPYYAFEDTVPDPLIYNQTWSNGILDPAKYEFEVCMTDSILLSTPDLFIGPNAATGDTLLSFQWQRWNTSSNIWMDVNKTNFDRFGDRWTLKVDTSMKPIRALSFYRLKVATLTPFSKSPVCEYITDSIVVRWKPVDSLLHQTDSWVYSVGKEHINFCARDSATLIASPTPSVMFNNGYNYSYQWLRDSLDTAIGKNVIIPIVGETAQTFVVHESGSYYVFIDDGICGDTVRPYKVTVDSIPSTTIVNVPATADRDLCLTDSVLVSATDTVRGLGGRWYYQWLTDVGAGWTPLANDTLPHLNIDVSYRPNGVDTVWFTLLTWYENQFGLQICPDTTARFDVRFYDPPTINFFPSDSIGVCAGDSVLVVAQGNSFSYVWSNGDVTADTYLKGAGKHTVVGTGINQCTSTREVVIYDLEVIANAGADVTILSGETANLSASGGLNYQWGADKPISWGDILSQNTTVSYTLPEGINSDTIKVYVTVSSSDGCTDTDTLLLIVTRDVSEGTGLIDQAWNVFTPDGNGKSDVWDISEITNRYGGCRIDIMNRWGSVVFATETFNGIWDGNNNGGNPLPDGTYYYILSCDGEIILKNAVTIIRNQ